uniref:Poly [ADP-ribose] polymerase n=1 Tax=Nothobranchius pienaari TaxID=704102 RepID=A0A1A8L517_9TELE
MPYRWQVQEDGQWTDLPDNETIEEDYCDPKNTYSTSSPPVHFDTMKLGENKVRRLSTLNSLVEPTFIHTTEWLWYWQDENGMWKLYGSDSGTHGSADINSATLEQKFLDNSEDEVEFSAGSQSYSLSFQDMIQTNKHYSTKRLVSRRPRFVSASDVKTKKFRRPLHSAPENWDKTKIPATGFLRVDLQRTSEEFQKVEALFSSTMQGFDIIKIERIQNKALWEVFQWQKNRMRDNNGGRYVTEKQLFHGTDSQHVDAICNDNFDWRICGTHGTAFGKGSYFARDAKYSDSYTGHMKDKTMFVSRVLVGRYTKGDPSYVRPPPKNDETNYYNSCVNDVKDPSIYVVFEKHQIYPEYLLKYKTRGTQDVSGTSVFVQKSKPILKPVPVAKPAISSYQPSTSSYQPSTSSYQSSTSSYQPSTSSYQSSTSSYQSSTSSYLSSTSSYPPGISYLPSTPSHLSFTSSSSTASSQNRTSSSSSVYKGKAEPKKSSDSCIIV